MVYDLTLTSVKIKLSNFDNPARLINHKELCCAIGMGYKQAGLEIPNIPNGKSIPELIPEIVNLFKSNPGIDDKIKFVVENYIIRPDEIMDDDAQVTLKLGYDSIKS